MPGIMLKLEGYARAQSTLKDLNAGAVAANTRGLKRIALLGHRESVKNAPISPTSSLLKAMRKTNRRVRRNPRATSRPMPGSLERSIDQRSDGKVAEIFVNASSMAGKYAFRIHSEKGISWQKRGPGTIAKGGRADHRFIERAITENEPVFVRVLEDEHNKAAPA